MIKAKNRFRKQKNSGDKLPSQNPRASGRAADPNSRKPMLTAEARDTKVVSSSGEVRASVPSTSAGTWFDSQLLFVRAHASVLLVVTNLPGKVNEVPTYKETLAKLRFNKYKNTGDQQYPCTVDGTVDSDSRGLIPVGVNVQVYPSTSLTGISILVLGLFRY